MAEYIAREALRSEMYRQAFEENSPLQRWDSGCWIRFKMFEKAIDSAPAADVVPVRHGRWIDMGDFISCSECQVARLKEFESYYGKAMRLDARTNYCPNCGAKMEAE